MYREDEDFRTHRSEIDALVAILGAVGIRLSPQMAVLEVGGGQGMHTGFLCALVGTVFCADVIDYSTLYGGAFLKLLAEKHARNGVEFHLDRVAFHRTDAMNLLYRDAYFDGVVSINSFEHIPNPGTALAEMVRVTKPGGFVYIATDPIWTADTGSHFFHRVSEPWAQLLDDDDTFTSKMRAAGATADEVEEYRRAMNRWNASDFAREVERVERKGVADVLYRDSWSGVINDAHRMHENLRTLVARGFTEEELMVRGLRWVLRRRPASGGSMQLPLSAGVTDSPRGRAPH